MEFPDWVKDNPGVIIVIIGVIGIVGALIGAFMARKKQVSDQKLK